MAWETRSNGEYYYTKRRIGRQVISEYIGAGPVADIAAKRQALDIIRRQLEQAERQAEREGLAELDTLADEFTRRVKFIVTATLLAAGYHQHKRQWRKKRVKALTTDDRQYIGETLKRIYENKPQKGDFDFVATILEKDPTSYSLFGGDIEGNSIRLTIEKMMGDSATGKMAEKAIYARLKLIRNEYGFDSASFIEKLLIDQICLCWLRLYWVENMFSQYLNQQSRDSSILYFEKRLTFCQTRLMRAIETLAKIRRLARRTPEILQVNIAENQVNQANVGHCCNPPLAGG